MDFEAYLISKKIDSRLFADAEPALWNQWRVEFEQVHPNSFTAQKLYLINPLRRKFLLKVTAIEPKVGNTPPPVVEPAQSAPLNPKPAVPRPVFKPKPKPS